MLLPFLHHNIRSLTTSEKVNRVSVPSEWGSLCALIHYILQEKIQKCKCASPMSSCLNVFSIPQSILRDEVIKDCRRLTDGSYLLCIKRNSCGRYVLKRLPVAKR